MGNTYSIDDKEMFKEGDRVQIIEVNSNYFGKYGFVDCDNGKAVNVVLDNGTFLGYYNTSNVKKVSSKEMMLYNLSNVYM